MLCMYMPEVKLQERYKSRILAEVNGGDGNPKSFFKRNYVIGQMLFYSLFGNLFYGI